MIFTVFLKPQLIVLRLDSVESFFFSLKNILKQDEERKVIYEIFLMEVIKFSIEVRTSLGLNN